MAAGTVALWGHARWVALDERVAASVCCDMTAPAAQLVAFYRAPDPVPLERVLALPADGLLNWTALIPEALGMVGLDGLQIFQGVVLLLAQIGTWLWLRPVARPGGAVLAAALLPWLPGVAFATRMWDPYPLQYLLLTVVGAVAVRSDQGTRLGRMALAGLLCVPLSVSSPVLTDGVLGLAVGLSLCAGVALSGVAHRRWRGIGGGLAVLGGFFVGAVPVFGRRQEVQTYFWYYMRELGLVAEGPSQAFPSQPYVSRLDPWSREALLAYADRLQQHEVGPELAAVALVGVALLLLRRRVGSGALLSGLLPLVALSLVDKKQPFYVYGTLLAIPAVIGVGFGPGDRWPGWARALWVPGATALLGWQLWTVAVPSGISPVDEGRLPPPPPPTDPGGDVRFQHGLELSLRPGRLAEPPAELEFLRANLPMDCDRLHRVGVFDEFEYGPLAMILLAEGACIDLHRVDQHYRADFEYVLVAYRQPGRPYAGPACAMDPSLRWADEVATLEARDDLALVVEERVGRDQRCLRIFRVDAAAPGASAPGASAP
ncbi:MAG: hypothetical protein H6742_01785 [Alphaproteobacteria bacterium]|nr:hypothetical protein [Alphaproteobacteria bacterium]